MSDHSTIDRVVDIGSVALISAAAVLSALCSYQATRWSGAQAHFYNVSNVRRMEASEALNRGLALTAINVNLFLSYFSAKEANDSRKAAFLYARMPGEMRRALDDWMALKPMTNPHAPTSPFAMRAYSDKMQAASHDLNVRAAEAFQSAQLANEHSDNFMLLTVVFAGVSFLGGVSTKMQYPRHAVVIAVATLGLIFGIARLVFMPFL